MVCTAKWTLSHLLIAIICGNRCRLSGTLRHSAADRALQPDSARDSPRIDQKWLTRLIVCAYPLVNKSYTELVLTLCSLVRYAAWNGAQSKLVQSLVSLLNLRYTINWNIVFLSLCSTLSPQISLAVTQNKVQINTICGGSSLLGVKQK